MNYAKGSDVGTLSKYDWKKVGKGALIAIGGALIAYVGSEVIPQLQALDLSPGGALAVALSSVIVNFLQKWLSDTRY